MAPSTGGKSAAASVRVTPAELARACASVGEYSPNGDAQVAFSRALNRVCTWSVPSTIESSDWSAAQAVWESFGLLQADTSRARVLDLAYGRSPGAVGAFGSERGIAAFGLRSAGRSEGLASAASNVLWGVTDFVVRRAEEEARTVAQTIAARSICQGNGRWVWPEVCRLLTSDSIQGSFFGEAYRAGLAAAARSDLTSLPLRVMDSIPVDQPYDTLTRAVALLASEVAAGRPPAEALRRLTALARSQAPAVAEAELHSRLSCTEAEQRFVRLLVDVASFDLSGGFDNAVKAGWINGAVRDVGCVAIVQSATSPPDTAVIRVLAGASAMISALDDASAALEELRSHSEASDSVGRRVRQEAQVRVVAALWRAIDGAVSAALGDQDSAANRRLEPFRLLSTGLAARNYGQAIGGVLLLLESASAPIVAAGHGLDSLSAFVSAASLQGADIGVVQRNAAAVARGLCAIRRYCTADGRALDSLRSRLQRIASARTDPEVRAAFAAFRCLFAGLPNCTETTAFDVAIRNQVVRALRDYIPRVLTLVPPSYFAFIADVAQAQSPADVSRALDQFAAPRGTATSKRKHPGRFVALNAYLGITGGFERVDPSTRGSATAVAVSPALPIGVEVRLARGARGTWSAFAQLVDLGALAAYRIDRDTTVKNEPEVGLAQVFAPGLSVIWGAPGVPFSIGFGATYTPRLRAFDAGTVHERLGALRLAFTLALDVPLLVFAR